MAVLILFDEFGSDLGKAVHNFSTATLKIALSNTAPVQATGAVLANITQLGTGGGYTTGADGGFALDGVTWAEVVAGEGRWRLNSSTEIFTATGADVGPFQYPVLYNSTATNDPLIGYINLGAPVTVPNGQTFTITLSADGWFTIPIY